MMEEENKLIKKVVGEKLKSISFNLNGVKVALLGKNTNEIWINCNDGEVTDVKTTYKAK